MTCTHGAPHMIHDERPDAIDTMVMFETMSIRRRYVEACQRLHIPPRQLSPVVLMQRSVA